MSTTQAIEYSTPFEMRLLQKEPKSNEYFHIFWVLPPSPRRNQYLNEAIDTSKKRKFSTSKDVEDKKGPYFNLMDTIYDLLNEVV